MRGIGDEVSLRFERRVEPPEEVVEGVTEFLEFVSGSASARRSWRLAEEIRRAERRGCNWPSILPATSQPAPRASTATIARSDSRVHKKLMRVGGALGGLEGPACATDVRLGRADSPPERAGAGRWPIVAGPGSAVSPNGFRAREVTTPGQSLPIKESADAQPVTADSGRA